MPNFNGFLKLPPSLGGGYLRYQRSPAAHYGGTCLCDGWHIEAVPSDAILLHATNVQRHSSLSTKWDWADAMLHPAGSYEIEPPIPHGHEEDYRGNTLFPWHLVKPIRLWPKHLQTRRRRLIAVKRGQTTHGPFVLVHRAPAAWGINAWEALLASTGERVLSGHRRALIRAIESRKLNRGASLTLYAYWLSEKSDEWKHYRALYGG